MILIPAKCPDCGADLKIPEGSTSLVCEYCGGNILVTDILGSTSVMQNCMMLAYSAIENNNYKDAYDHFNRAIEIDLKNPSAWFGKAVSIGMIGKIGENSFGQMIDLFENSFKYAPADKQTNFKKNAAAEIVKVIRHSAKIIQFSSELLLLETDEELSKSVSSEVMNLREKVTKTVQKAKEYDSSNQDVTALLNEVTSGAFFKSDLDTESDIKDISQSGDYKPITSEQDKSQINYENQTSKQTNSGKKSGCAFVILIFIIAISAVGLLIA